MEDFGCVALENETYKSLGLCQSSFFQKSLPACMSLKRPVSLPHFCTKHFDEAKAASSPQLIYLPFNILLTEGFEGMEANDLWAF